MVSTVRGAGVCDEAGAPSIAGATTVTTNTAKPRDAGSRISEGQVRGQLNLSRRSRLARGEAGARDLAERRASDHVAGRSEVGVVEEVEGIRAQAQAVAVPHGQRLRDRQVRVDEAGADHHVAAQVAETIDGGERRRIEPLVHRPDDSNGAYQVGAHAVRHAVEGAAA